MATNDAQTLISLERKFWDALVAQDAQAAIDLLAEPALMVSEHGTLRFDHEQYRRMAEHGPQVLKAYEFSDVQVTFPDESVAIVTYRARQEVAGRDASRGETQHVNDSSTWLRGADGWRCVMHTETPARGDGRRS
jgi:ketosteroid isomerase-like protein